MEYGVRSTEYTTESHTRDNLATPSTSQLCSDETQPIFSLLPLSAHGAPPRLHRWPLRAALVVARDWVQHSALYATPGPSSSITMLAAPAPTDASALRRVDSLRHRLKPLPHSRLSSLGTPGNTAIAPRKGPPSRTDTDDRLTEAYTSVLWRSHQQVVPVLHWLVHKTRAARHDSKRCLRLLPPTRHLKGDPDLQLQPSLS